MERVSIREALVRKYGVKTTERILNGIAVLIVAWFLLQLASVFLEDSGGAPFTAIRVTLGAVLIINMIVWLFVIATWWREKQKER
jgi:Na+/melibiose symporter-like transporter